MLDSAIELSTTTSDLSLDVSHINPNFPINDPGVYWFHFSVDFDPDDTNKGARVIRVYDGATLLASNVLQPYSNQGLQVSNKLTVDGVLKITADAHITVTVETTNLTGDVNVVDFSGLLMRAIPGT